MKIFLTFFSLLLFLIFYKYNNKIGKKLGLLDKNKTPLIGGIFLYLGILINYIFLTEELRINDYLIDLYFLSSMFLISLADDKYNLKPTTRILFLVIFIIFFIDKNHLFINSLNSKIFGFYYFPENNFIKFFFPAFCMLVFINSYNFTDGINGLATLIGLSWFIYLFFKNPFLIDLYNVFLIFIVFFIFCNFLNKFFLGDSGNHIISTIIGSIVIITNQNFPYSIYVEEILLLFLIPGIDLVRLFFKRINNKKNPLSGDLNHFHHILLKKFSLIKTLLVYLSLVNIPLYIYLNFENTLILLIIISITIYTLIVLKYSKN